MLKAVIVSAGRWLLALPVGHSSGREPCGIPLLRLTQLSRSCLHIFLLTKFLLLFCPRFYNRLFYFIFFIFLQGIPVYCLFRVFCLIPVLTNSFIFSTREYHFYILLVFHKTTPIFPCFCVFFLSYSRPFLSSTDYFPFLCIIIYRSSVEPDGAGLHNNSSVLCSPAACLCYVLNSCLVPRVIISDYRENSWHARSSLAYSTVKRASPSSPCTPFTARHPAAAPPPPLLLSVNINCLALRSSSFVVIYTCYPLQSYTFSSSSWLHTFPSFLQSAACLSLHMYFPFPTCHAFLPPAVSHIRVIPS